MSTFKPQIDHIANFSLKAYLTNKLKSADRPFWSAFLALFISLNILFLFHGAHYLFGDHDWQYLKNGVSLTAGLFEGRFTQFIFINLLTQGEILPLLNNTIGFFGYALGIALLARYWQLPRTLQTYILFALFTGITPFILSFMYFAFLIIPVLSWSAFIIGGLLVSEYSSRFPSPHTALAIFLFTLALGGYPPVINLFCVALTTRLTIGFILKSPQKTFTQTLVFPLTNFILSALIYKLILIYLTHAGGINSSYYNLQTTPLSEWPEKFLLVLKDYILQFTATLPFLPASYKTATLVITLTALSSLFFVSKKNTFVLLIFFAAIPLSGLVTLFLSPSLAETEFSPRIDFFGLNYAYSAMFALCLLTKCKFLKNIATATALFSLIISAHLISEAQKVWQLGFTAESLYYKRVLKRYEQDKRFNPQKKYIIVQAGSPSFRPKYYHTPYKYQSDDLLSISYTPGLNAGVMWNYLSPTDYADTRAYVYTFTPDESAVSAIQTAAPYPSANSVVVGDYWLLTVLTPEGLTDLKSRYHLF